MLISDLGHNVGLISYRDTVRPGAQRACVRRPVACGENCHAAPTCCAARTRLCTDADFHNKNAERSTAITMLQGFFFPWGMPLFFLIAGMGSWFALRRRTAGQGARPERVDGWSIRYRIR